MPRRCKLTKDYQMRNNMLTEMIETNERRIRCLLSNKQETRAVIKKNDFAVGKKRR